jgi:hypothetical protein
MVYASIKEVWGVDDFCREPPNNPYVVKDPVADPANFRSFRKKNFTNSSTNRVVRDADSEATSHASLDNETVSAHSSVSRIKKWCKPDYRRRYFLEKDDDHSEISSEDRIREKIVGKKIKLGKNPIIKNIKEGFSNQHVDHSSANCSSMLDHLRNCKICRSEIEDESKQVFIKEFIIFAGSGLMIFLFLDLLRKIVQKSS